MRNYTLTQCVVPAPYMNHTDPSSNAATAKTLFDAFMGAMKALPYCPGTGEFVALFTTMYHPGRRLTNVLYRQSDMPPSAAFLPSGSR